MVNVPFNVLLRIWAKGDSQLTRLGLSACVSQAQPESRPHKLRGLDVTGREIKLI